MTREAMVTIAGLLGIALLAGGIYLMRPAARDGSLLRPDDKALVARGAEIYQAQCASCHGADLEGEPDWRSPRADGLMPAPPDEETGHTWHHPDELLFRITKYGVAKAANLDDYESAMPAYEAILKDEEIVAVLSWIKARWPPEIRARHDELNAQYRQAER